MTAATLEDYCFLDARVVLVPTEHLSPDGLEGSFAAALRERAGWSDARTALLERGFALYWRRAAALAARTPLRPPRRRSIAVVRSTVRVRPYAALLNTSAWTIHESDLDPERSHPELICWALVAGDRRADTGEVSRVAIDLAPYWLERTDAEVSAFTAAARAASGPDAPLYRLVADALPWLRQLRHETIRPPRLGKHRRIPATGVLVPLRLEAKPDELVAGVAAAARAAIAAYRAQVSTPGGAAVGRLCERLAAAPPPLLVTVSRGRVVWDPQTPDRVAELRAALADAPAEAVLDVDRDLGRVGDNTARFLDALAAPEQLPRPGGDIAQRGYTFLHRERGMIAYDLHEPRIDRLAVPALPYAREMLGARTWHEWAHLAVEGGCVPPSVDEARWRDLERALAERLDEAVARAPRAIRTATARDLEALPGTGTPGERLVALLATRLPDYRANLLACRFMTFAERETYVRHNVRSLSREYPPEQLWRLLVRLLYEAQYLRFSQVEDRAAYFLDTTWFRDDFLATGALAERDVPALDASVGALCGAHAVDPTRFKPGALPPPAWRE